MRWSAGSNPDVEDRRGSGGGMRFGGRGLGVGGLLVVLVLSVVFKRDFLGLLGGGSDPSAPGQGPVESSPSEESLKSFVGAVLDSVQTTWDAELSRQGKVPYQHARLVLFRDAIESACGFAEAATGPFYCPGDKKVYVDLGFFQELAERFGAPGDFAQAYVLAHEIGHHVQFLLGTEQQVRSAMNRNPGEANALSVALELQADCYAGVWAHWAAEHGTLETGDVDEALAAAAAVGDDRIARMSGRAVNPDGFTHGSASQRSNWFKRGQGGGRLTDCEAFEH
ncbi:MAG TPA: neutral zinc metallopeptidase [Gemmatimonadales bacterium]|nr:neutral zinc metallopeptidase [Gemmatimonadales bacterium]